MTTVNVTTTAATATTTAAATATATAGDPTSIVLTKSMAYLITFTMIPQRMPTNPPDHQTTAAEVEVEAPSPVTTDRSPATYATA